jgi:hypothetical protein
MSDSKTYTGGCHCKQNRFEVTLSPPLDNENNKIISCNCSICSSNAYLLAFSDIPGVKWEHGGLDNMKQYNFGTGQFNHFFCTNCGTSVCVSGALGGLEQIGMNVSTKSKVTFKA